MERLEKLYRLLEAKNGQNTVIIDISEMATFANYFIITGAMSTPHLKQLKEEVKYDMKHEEDELPLSMEGEPASGWIIIDYNDIIVHCFSAEKREYYDLERIWGSGKRISFED